MDWLKCPDGKTRKTYLFIWLDDFSRKILFGKYYDSEKLPCLEDSFQHMVLRWGIPEVVYVDYPEKKQIPKFVRILLVSKEMASRNSA